MEMIGRAFEWGRVSWNNLLLWSENAAESNDKKAQQMLHLQLMQAYSVFRAMIAQSQLQWTAPTDPLPRRKTNLLYQGSIAADNVGLVTSEFACGRFIIIR